MDQNRTEEVSDVNYPYYNFPQRHDVIRVNGKNGADAFQLAPNSSVLLLDETAPMVWLKVTDGAGYATVTGYDISPAKTPEEKEAGRFDALEKRISSLEALINGKPDSGRSKSKQDSPD